MARRFVHATNGVPPDHYRSTPAFTERERPARTIGEALAVSRDGDVIEVLDTNHYREDGLVIDKRLTLVSSAWLDPTRAKPTSSTWRLGMYPAISPVRGHGRALLVQGDGQARPVEVAGFVIRDGLSRAADAGDPAIGAGGGIAIVDVGTNMEERTRPSGLLIRDCYFTRNSTRSAPGGRASLVGLHRIFEEVIEGMLRPMDVATHVASLFRDRVPGVPRERVDEALELIRSAISSARGTLHQHFTVLPRTLPNHSVAGQAFGAGLCFVWSSGTVRGCVFENNVVSGRGGGAAVVGYGWPIFEDCVFRNNRANSITRRDGGGLGLEIAIPDRFTRDLHVQHLVTDLERWLRGLGVSDVVLLAGEIVYGVFDYAMSIGFGRQPPPASFGEIFDIGSDLFEGDTSSLEALGSELLGVIIHLIAKAYLRVRRDDLWLSEYRQAALQSRVLVRRCTFTGNRADDDGGGLYASVLARVRVEQSNFVSNVATHGGGGAVRTSLASDIEIDTCVLQDNRAGGAAGLVGGGAIAVRNADLVIEGATVISTNRTDNWAGGAIQISAESEGGATFLGSLLPSYYDAILIAIFEFDRLDARVSRNTSIAGNTAGVGAHSTHGKGGGVYVLRGTQVDVPPLTVRIDSFRRNVVGNTGHGRSTAGGTYHEICLTDLATNPRQDIGDRNVSTILSGSDLRYTSG